MGEGSNVTYYDVLGVSEGASAADVEAAYRRRIKTVHPDRNDAADAAEQFRLVRRAREILVDPDERGRYDRLGHEEYVHATKRGPWPHERGEQDTAPDEESTERAANESDHDKTRAAAGRASATAGTSTASADSAETDRSGTDGTAGAGSWSVGTGDGAARQRARARRRNAADWQRDPRARTASGGSAYAVRREHASAEPRPSVGLSSSRSMLALATFIVYPGLLYSSVAPAFPVWVNGIVFLCTLLAVAAILTDPEVGMIAFGGWLFVGPFALSAAGVGVLSVPGGVFMLACLVPFALSAGLRFSVRP